MGQRPPSLGSRLASRRSLLSLLLAGLLLAFFVSRQDPAELREAGRQLAGADPLLFLAALATYYLNFPVRALRWRLLLVNAGSRPEEIPRNRDLAEIIYLSWFANALVPAKLGDLYRGWLLRREGGSSWTHGMGTIVAERILDLIVLVVLMVTAGLLTYGDVLAADTAGGPWACLASRPSLEHLGCALLQLFVLGAAGALAMILALIVLARYGRQLEPRMPRRLAQLYQRFSGALVLSFKRFGRLLGLSLAAWAFEGAAFWLVGLSLGQALPIPLVVFFALLQAFITVIPLTPGGLGFEPILAAALELRGLAAGPALAMTGLYRAISYLSLIAGGALVYLLSKKTK